MQLHAPTLFMLAKPNPSCNRPVSLRLLQPFHNRLAVLKKQSFSGRARCIAIVEPIMERQAAAVRRPLRVPYNPLHECGPHLPAHNTAALAAAAVAA
jgi:hypothetical protein